MTFSTSLPGFIVSLVFIKGKMVKSTLCGVSWLLMYLIADLVTTIPSSEFAGDGSSNLNNVFATNM